jgi:scyllo-inositol 2-dehydrogenase (NADP+)
MRVAILGFGLAGRVFHAPLIDAVDGLDVSVVVTTNADRAAQARAAYPSVEVVATPEEAFERCDLVVVATPNRSHAPLALAAFERDLPVVIDKPFAVTSGEAESVLDAGGRVTVFQNRRWDGDFLTAQRLVAEGALGEVVRFDSRFERFRADVKAGWREHGDPNEGGGQLFDLGAHLVDQAMVLLGTPVRLYAEVATRRAGAEVDDDAFIALEHESGAISHLAMGAVVHAFAPRIAVQGLAGAFAVHGLDPQEPMLDAGLKPGVEGFGRRDEPGRLVGRDGAERSVAISRGRYQDFYAGVRAWLTEGAEPPVDPRDSLIGLRVLEAARRSAATHEVIDLKDVV